jgi:hypothetical protein
MRKPNRNIWWLFTGFLCISALGWFGNTFTPGNMLALSVFLLLIFLTLFFFLLYPFNNVRRSFLVSLGVVVFLFLRYINLRYPVYPLLLVLTLFSVDHYFSEK